VKPYESHYRDSSQVYCGQDTSSSGLETLVSPPHEHNDACCGGNRTVKGNPWTDVNGTAYYRDVEEAIVFGHNNQHYDASIQLCCNEDRGYPSTRDLSATYTYDYIAVNDTTHVRDTVADVISVELLQAAHHRALGHTHLDHR
jgi:hypothetical protein